MKILNNPLKIAKAKEELHIAERFSDTSLPFFITVFEKGETLSSPLVNRNCIFIVLSGSVNVYALSEEGEVFPGAVLGKGAVLGDMEYESGKASVLYADAVTKTECLSINMVENREKLDRDVKFLRMLISSMAKKVYLSSMIDASAVSLEKKLLYYMDNMCDNKTFNKVENVVMQLRCSRRQLQRVLKKLLDEGVVEKKAKGTYVKIH